MPKVVIRSKCKHCIELAVCKGLCQKHYGRFYKYGDALFKVKEKNRNKRCSVEGCGKKHLGHGYCSYHYGLFIYNDKIKKHRLNRKLEVFLHYSEPYIKCACCPEKNLIFLTLDHIVPIKRQSYGTNYHTSDRLFSRLIKENFPEGYQVLCYNCNCAKRLNQYCPHQLNRMKKF